MLSRTCALIFPSFFVERLPEGTTAGWLPHLHSQIFIFTGDLYLRQLVPLSLMVLTEKKCQDAKFAKIQAIQRALNANAHLAQTLLDWQPRNIYSLDAAFLNRHVKAGKGKAPRSALNR